MSDLKAQLSEDGKKIIAGFHSKVDELHKKIDEYADRHDPLRFAVVFLVIGIIIGAVFGYNLH